MKVFVSWSGQRSNEVAEALSGWIRKVVQSSDVFYSPEMERGKRWLDEITKFVDQVDVVGIICVTPENADSRWINFEAGALSRHVGEGRVVPYLFGFKSAGDLGPPLGQFNASLADETGTWSLVQTLNKCTSQPLSEIDLKETFDVWWPRLKPQLEGVNSAATPVKATRSDDDKLDELLDLTRELSREVAGVREDRRREGRRDLYERSMQRVLGRPILTKEEYEATIRRDEALRSKEGNDANANRRKLDLFQEGLDTIINRHAPDLGPYITFPATGVVAVAKVIDPQVIARIETDTQMLTGIRPKVIFQPNVEKSE